MKLRCAILMSGHMRTCIDRYPSFKKNVLDILEPHFDIDIFISTWNVNGYRKCMDITTDIYNKFDEVQRLYKPKTLLIESFNREKFNNFSNDNWWVPVSHLAGPNTSSDACSMWYKINTLITLVPDMKKYHFVMKTRPDVEYLTPLDMNEVDLSMKGDQGIRYNKIYIPEFDGKYEEVRKGMVDHIAFGTGKTMDIYCSLFSNIKDYTKNPKCIQSGEGFLAYHVDMYSIKVERTKIKYSIVNNV